MKGATRYAIAARAWRMRGGRRVQHLFQRAKDDALQGDEAQEVVKTHAQHYVVWDVSDVDGEEKWRDFCAELAQVVRCGNGIDLEWVRTGEGRE